MPFRPGYLYVRPHKLDANFPCVRLSNMPKDITAFFERYRDAFNALDGQAIADLYAEPSGIAQDGTYTHWPTRGPVRENMNALCDLYRSRGYAGTSFRASWFMAQGGQYAIADLLWHIEWSSGAEPWTFKTTYNLVRTEQGWKVLLCTAYEEASLSRAPGAA
jgi:ketosteroid isomerase-like protein